MKQSGEIGLSWQGGRDCHRSGSAYVRCRSEGRLMRGDQSLFCPGSCLVRVRCVYGSVCVCYGPGQVYFSWIHTPLIW